MSLEADLVRRIVALEKRVDNLVFPERGWTPHFLTTPYTNTNFDGDSFSDTAETKIENTDWSTTIPANAKALLMRASARDSDSAGTDGLYFALYGASGATAAAIVYLSGITNDQWVSENFTIPCTDGDIWYTVNASGANTLDCYLWVFGYWV